MRILKKIAWQKYEDLLQNQLDSPILDHLYSQLVGDQDDDDDEDDDEDRMTPHQSGYRDEGTQNHFAIPLSERLIENISLATNFDCWMGHTNFNITEEILDKLNSTEGVEILKICSRYRFFVGVGRMFDFTDVRQNIEKTLAIEKGKEIGQENREVPE